MVLGRTAEHGGPPYIDLFDRLLKSSPRPGDSFFEGIKVYHHQIDHPDAVLLGCSLPVASGSSRRQSQPAVDFGVEGLHPSVHHFGEIRCGRSHR